MTIKKDVIARPDFVDDEHLVFLDNLRELGTINMFLSQPYIERKFGVEQDEAMGIFLYWAATFSERNRDSK